MSPDTSGALQRAYDEAWDRYAARCLWYVRRLKVADAWNAWYVAKQLRKHGDAAAVELAKRLEELAGREPYHPPL